MITSGSLIHYDIGAGAEAFSTTRDASLPYPVIQAHQTHSDRVALITDPNTTRADLEGVDALITRLPRCAIGARTADCIPVLLYDPEQQAIAAIHAGWRGTVLHIVCRTIEQMRRHFRTDPAQLKAIIGPGIGFAGFQVGAEVVEAFRDAGFPMQQIWEDQGAKQPGSMTGGHHIDLWEANRWLLTESGVLPGHIQMAGLCTYGHPELFYSARREGTACPRLIHAIRLL